MMLKIITIYMPAARARETREQDGPPTEQAVENPPISAHKLVERRTQERIHNVVEGGTRKVLFDLEEWFFSGTRILRIEVDLPANEGATLSCDARREAPRRMT